MCAGKQAEATARVDTLERALRSAEALASEFCGERTSRTLARPRSDSLMCLCLIR